MFLPARAECVEIRNQCKRRVAFMAVKIPNATAIDFMLPNLVTESDDSYWDGLHYRMSIADRLATDLAAIAGGGETDEAN